VGAGAAEQVGAGGMQQVIVIEIICCGQ
jgi:hypothetical protein